MKKNVIISLVAVLLIIGIGFTFAYFISGVSLSGNGSDVNADTGELMEVEYDAGTEEVNVSGVVPGDIITKEFDIILRPTNIENEATYAIKLDISSNTFVKCDDSNYDSITNQCTQDVEELVYRLKDSDNETIAEGTLMGLTGEQILAIETKTASDVTTYHYTLEIEFVETNADQNHNMNKEFKGRVIVEFSEGWLLKDKILADNPTRLTRTDFSTIVTDTTTDKIYYADTSNGRTYYFAGNPTNNWVQFAGFWWRIIRINEDGSIRMIYAGEVSGDTAPATTGTSTQVGTSTFSINSSTYNNNAYVGYMYTLNQVHGLGTDSGIKGVVDQWYEDNLTNYAQYLSTEAGFCGDREPSTNGSTSNGSGGTGTTDTYYGAFIRLARSSPNPTFECQNDSDLYTVASASVGNKALDYPIGVITADEVVYAGGTNNSENQSYYLYTNQFYWTMSPFYYDTYGYARVFRVDANGELSSNGSVQSPWGVRPVINLSPDVTITGSGTISDPYEVA